MLQRIPDPISDAADTLRTNYVAFAGLSLLLWDHVDTFADEVEYIWKGRKSLFVYLFLFNRYFTPLGFVVNLHAYLSPLWNPTLCRHFVRYEGCTVALAVEGVGLMMLVRITALYPRQKWISRSLLLLLIIETIVNAWLISTGEPVVHNPASGVHSCSMVFDPAVSGAASASAWMPLLYDTICFGLTVYRTIPPLRREEASYIIKCLLEDGILYYSVIFAVTLVLTIMIIAAPPGTKNIAAQLEQLVTVAMMSRITLNLRKAGRHIDEGIISGPNSLFSFGNIQNFGRWSERAREMTSIRSLKARIQQHEESAELTEIGNGSLPQFHPRPFMHYGPAGLVFASSVPPTPGSLDLVEDPAVLKSKKIFGSSVDRQFGVFQLSSPSPGITQNHVNNK